MSTATNGRYRQVKIALAKGRFDYGPYLGAGAPSPHFVSELGVLFAGDCLDVLPSIRDESVDSVFADPPFNLGKQYGRRTNDQRSDYLEWCQSWLDQCVRVLKPGGSLFVYNLPKWNVMLGAYLTNAGLDFRHWIAIEISACMPIPGRLHPSHYSLIYYSKGKPKTFRRLRTPIQTCRHCGEEVKDYGGHRDAMNPNGVTLKDVWTDIPPVRHWKFKSKNRRANALSTKTLDRVVEMSTVPGDLVLDPFGGSGTTFAVCEAKSRHWIGIELDFAPEIVERFESDEIRSHRNDDYVEI
ncbi:MAG TPA: site-specific DNA-methyltransferase [Pirellulales bacterium]|nr:site-specific DNA-methyltransferase [Pirellulales bacterium]